MALGWILGGLVWALLISLVLVLWEGRSDLSGGNIAAMLQAAVMGVPAAAPGALVFLGLGLLLFALMGRQGSPVGAGGFGGLLFLLASGLAWKFGGASPLVAALFGLFPIEAYWAQLMDIAKADGAAYAWLAVHTLAPLIAGMIGGALYDAVAGAARAARRRGRLPPVNFG
ncbi:hypothetical protein [Caulobacter sp. NIBR1757]|uniref:hypothetical protein n=1 Tax=Caulobacter sp. NIBR1757 TaxID=3016000 RepID=UPI0022F06D61|nr:hypothetical protein [Caulobacter sp. NIBR1757]